MFGTPFYFSLIRKYVILVGTLFNNIRITKDNNSVDEFLLDLILKSAEPLEPLLLTPSAPPEE